MVKWAEDGRDDLCIDDCLPLLAACRLQDKEVRSWFFSHPTVSPDAILFTAAKENDIDLLKKLLGVTADGATELGRAVSDELAESLLIAVCSHGHIDLLRLLFFSLKDRDSGVLRFIPTDECLARAVVPRGVWPPHRPNTEMVSFLLEDGRATPKPDLIAQLMRMEGLGHELAGAILDRLHLPSLSAMDAQNLALALVSFRLPWREKEASRQRRCVSSMIEKLTRECLASLQAAPEDFKNTFLRRLTRICPEKTRQFLEDEAFLDGLNLSPRLLLVLCGIPNDDDFSLIRLCLEKKMIASAQVSVRLSRLIRVPASEALLRYQLSVPGVDPSVPAPPDFPSLNAALCQAVRLRRIDLVKLLLNNPLIRVALPSTSWNVVECLTEEDGRHGGHEDTAASREIVRLLLAIPEFNPTDGAEFVKDQSESGPYTYPQLHPPLLKFPILSVLLERIPDVFVDVYTRPAVQAVITEYHVAVLIIEAFALSTGRSSLRAGIFLLDQIESGRFDFLSPVLSCYPLGQAVFRGLARLGTPEEAMEESSREQFMTRRISFRPWLRGSAVVGSCIVADVAEGRWVDVLVSTTWLVSLGG